MGRVAGTSRHYTFEQTTPDLVSCIHAKTGQPTGDTFNHPGEVGTIYKLVSVTSVLDAVVAKPGLMHWYYTEGLNGIAELGKLYGNRLPIYDVAGLRKLLAVHGFSPYSRKKSAGAHGTSVHDQLEQAVESGTMPTDAGLLDFYRDVIVGGNTTVLGCETVLADFNAGYAGTCDLVYELDGVTYLADLKTSKNVMFEHFIQLDAYKQAWENAGGQKIDKLVVLHVPRTGSGYTIQESTINPRVWDLMLELYGLMPTKWKPELLAEEM